MAEIGPGLGALTCALLPRLHVLDVIEFDIDVLPELERRCAGLGTLRIHSADALTFDFCSLVQPGGRLRVVGNLPYNISTPLLFHLFGQIDCLRDMCFMLQKEVVDRLDAQPGTPDYGRLSVMAQAYCRVEKIFGVGSGAFSPPPKVESAVVRLTPHTIPPVANQDMRRFERVVKQAFAQRRKTLRNTLRSLMSVKEMQSVGIDPGRRAETLTLGEFAALANVSRD